MSLYGGRGTFILEGFREYKDVAFTARSPYLLVECCPGPITSNAAAIPQFQWRPQRNCFLPWDFPASLPKHRVLMAEGINLRSGGNWFAAIPICSLLLRLGSRFTPIDLCMALNRLHGFNFGGLCNERYPKNSLIPYCTQDSRKTLWIWLSIPKFGWRFV